MCADDVMFGNTFDRPLKLPWGSGAALKFMKYVSVSLLPIGDRPGLSSDPLLLLQLCRPHLGACTRFCDSLGTVRHLNLFPQLGVFAF